MSADLKLSDIPDVDIDDVGLLFKYITMNVKNIQTGESKSIIRGYEECEYHADIYDRVAPFLQDSGFQVTCPGGGRIGRNADEIFVFGYSVGFGRGDHNQACEIIKKWLEDNPGQPGQDDKPKIHWSNDGY